MPTGLPEHAVPLGAPHRTPQRVVEAAEALAGCPVAAYVIDLDGSCAIRLAGDATCFPERIQARLGVGPELPAESVPAMIGLVRDVVAGADVAVLRARGRVFGFLVARERPVVGLAEFAEQAGVALELDSGYSDALHGVRRRKEIQPAAEIQQDLLPPRISRVNGADLAGGVLPGYDVGGDFFDHAGNAEGVWLIVADAVGKGNMAAALSSLALGALRAARRSGFGLAEAAQATHSAVLDVGDGGHFLTALIAIWDPATATLRWTACGHPPPLLWRADGGAQELDGARTFPLGVFEEEREFPIGEARVGPGDRLVLYSDGVTERRAADGAFFGVPGIVGVLGKTNGATAAGTVRALQDAVIAVTSAPMRDDATILVLAPD